MIIELTQDEYQSGDHFWDKGHYLITGEYDRYYVKGGCVCGYRVIHGCHHWIWHGKGLK